MPKPQRHVFVCTQIRPPGHPRGCCNDRGGKDVVMQLFNELEQRQLVGTVNITETSCLGPCPLGPMMVVYPDAVWYNRVKEDDVAEIVEKHLVGGKPVDRLKVPDEMWG
jgi:(2Fe-2S) ferredoxin